MATPESPAFEIGYLETLAQQPTRIHAIDPRAKLLIALLYILVVMSFDQYAISGLIPFLIYPAVMIAAANLPVAYLLKRVCWTLPFVGFVAIFNPLFDREIALRVGEIGISDGWLSFLSILLRGAFAVLSALILVATTGFYGVCRALGRLGAPRLFVTQLLFVYRYLFVLLDEASRMMRARALRSFSGRGMGLATWGALTGHLLLRAIDRADRIHAAMLSRGFDGEIRLPRRERLRFADWLFFVGWAGLFIFMRMHNLSLILGNALAALFHSLTA